jgi:hypothetical protein
MDRRRLLDATALLLRGSLATRHPSSALMLGDEVNPFHQRALSLRVHVGYATALAKAAPAKHQHLVTLFYVRLENPGLMPLGASSHGRFSLFRI